MSITSVSFTFENGVKREEYGPTRKASATITAGVDDGQDGVDVLFDIANVARDQVQSALGLPKAPPMEDVVVQVSVTATRPTQTAGAPAAAEETAASVASEQQAADTTSHTGDATSRKPRRTRAQIDADEAAAKLAAAGAGKDPEIQSEGLPLGEGSQGISSGSQAAEGDPWAVGDGEKATEITDDELTQACAAAAQRLSSSDKVKGVIASFKPTSNWPEGKPFSVKDILVSQRPGFLGQLKDLKA